jgi:hypothetical protein
VIKPDKAPLIQQETDVVVEPQHQDRGIELELAKPTPSPATGRGAENARELGRRRPPNADTLQNGS